MFLLEKLIKTPISESSPLSQLVNKLYWPITERPTATQPKSLTRAAHKRNPEQQSGGGSVHQPASKLIFKTLKP